MYRALSIGIAAVAAVILLLGHGPRPAEAATTVYVTSNADSGAGTFRAAVDQANSNPDVNVIKFLTNGPVTLQSQVFYTGSQSLTISGLLKTVIQGSSCGPHESALLLSTSGGDLTLLNLTFQNNACGHGVRVILPSTDRTVSLTLNGVLMKNNAASGFLVTEDDEECINRPASINLNVLYSSFTGNVESGVRAREYGEGGLAATVRFSQFKNNGEDGLALDEGCDGDLTLKALTSTFNENGDDGAVAEESGGGQANATFAALNASGNGQDGIDFNETDEGAAPASLGTADADEVDEAPQLNRNPEAATCTGDDLTLTVSGGVAVNNGEDGIEADEESCGHLYATFTMVMANGNGDEGIELDEEEGGDALVSASATQTSDNGRDTFDGNGIDIDEFDDGSIDAELSGFTANANGSADGDGDGIDINESSYGSATITVNAGTILKNLDDGVDVDENYCGDVDASFSLAGVNLNAGAGFELDQEAGCVDDEGNLTVPASTVFGNGSGNFDLDGVVLN
ncbi:MAG: hypothetical protein AB7U23_16315 [Dehalococcoidia bacterium]